jgi:hypothetical protein
MWYQRHFAWYYPVEQYFFGHQTWQSFSVLGNRVVRDMIKSLWEPVIEEVKYDWSHGAPVIPKNKEVV